ncbi:hypothetical protein BH09VER1_BH09VER1_34310 [soil metagenome]
MDRKGILLVDDEALALKYFSKAFGNRFPIYSASSAREALRVLEVHHSHIGVIVTDQRMPESTGVELLKIVRNQYPNTARILTTAYTEMDMLVAAINIGAVHSFVAKPWELSELEKTLLNALEHHEHQTKDAVFFEQTITELKTKLLDHRAYDVGLIAAKIGHYVHNALCPLTFLLDQLLNHDQSGVVYSAGFLQSVRTHIYDVARTLKDLEQASVPVAPEDCESLNLEEILDKALVDTEIIRNQKNFRFEKIVSSPVPRIHGALPQIEKLFRFMIAEEIVSLPAESLVRLKLSAHEADGEILGANIEFEDFVPVPQHARVDSLLHPFNLRGSNPREFGVFLVSCYFIAQHHGGSLNVRVKEDEGLAFSFFLPSDPQKIAPPEVDSLKSSTPKSSPSRRPNHDR